MRRIVGLLGFLCLSLGSWLASTGDLADAAATQSAMAKADFRPLIAVCLAFETSVSPTPTPTPTPAGDKCENCRGTGKLGDGTIFVPCPVCDGTGKKKTEPPPPIVKPDPPKETKKDEPKEWYDPYKEIPGAFRWRAHPYESGRWDLVKGGRLLGTWWARDKTYHRFVRIDIDEYGNQTRTWSAESEAPPVDPPRVSTSPRLDSLPTFSR